MELKDISEWWKGLYGTCGLTYARDRMVKAYFWSYTVFYEQNYARARMMYAKLVVLISLLDDTYDAHATIEECRELSAIQRWDESAVSLVPEYLKNFYHKLLETFCEFEEEVAIIDNHRIDYAKRAFQKQSTYYLQEAEWLHQNHKPCFEDHVHLSSMSSAVPLLCVGMMVGMGDAITDEALEWAVGTPDAVVASAKIGRFMNDIAAYKHGKNKGDIESSVECHMNEHQVTSDDAFATIDSLVENEWKTINQARFEHHAILSTVKRVVNMAVSMRLYYDDRKDAYTFGTILEDVVNNVFLKPVTI
uniref:Uncharacterized protein n=1 Tax=Avena sativa TaxID=4498 RepID=A0ACD5XKH0_AVESA